MTSLKAEPAGPVRSLEELFAIAHAMECDAVARYTETAAQLRQQGAAQLAGVFDRLADVERGHVHQVTVWAERSERPEPSKTPLPWIIPDTFDAPPGETAKSKLLTPYRALASAVRHEERSFAFWTYVAAHADKTDVKKAAEHMALEELEHVSLLRRERREAFHAEGEDAKAGSTPRALTELATLERHLAEVIEQRPETAAGGEFAASIVSDAKRAAAMLERMEDSYGPLSLPDLPAERRNDLAAISEYLVDAYLSLAEIPTDAETLSAAQDLASVAIYRLATLRSVAAVSDDD
jgi:rubrerythrin